MNPQRMRRIMALGLPIIGGMVSQNVLNLVDAFFVGRLGVVSLAAVGQASFASFMSQALILGLSIAVQAMASRRLGEGKESTAAVPLNGGLLLSCALGLPWSVVLFVLAPRLFPLLNGHPEVIALAVPYWQARIVSVMAVGINFSFRGYFNGVNRSSLYFKTLLVMHLSNVVFNYALIFGHLGAPALGVLGAGIGSAMATFIGTLTYFYLGLTRVRHQGFLRHLPGPKTLLTLLRLAIPTSLQQFSFATGFTVLFWIVAQVGTAAVAAAHVVFQIALVAVLPGLGLGLAAASLVGQALGRADPMDAKTWGWEVMRVALVVMSLLGLPMILMPEAILGLFITDPPTIAVGIPPLRITGVAMAIDAFGLVLLNALMGAGDTRRVMIVSVLTQWGLSLPAAYLAGSVWGLGLTGICLAHVAHRFVLAGGVIVLWHRGRWATISV